MEAKISRASLWESVSPALRKLLQKPFKRDDPAALPLWKKYLTTRSQADAERLYEFYLPFVRVGVFKLMMSRPWLFPDGIGGMVSDAFLALRRVIEYTDSFDPDHFRAILFLAIRRRIFQERDRMTFAGRREAKQSILAAIRSKLTARLGRLPERHELAVELRRQFKNPNLYFAHLDDPAPKMVRFSELENPAMDRPIDVADPTADDPSKRVIESDLLRRTMNVLKPRDRKILRMVLRGENGATIARRFGISREYVRQRLNGILWEARKRADLATYFGPEWKDVKQEFERDKNNCLPTARRLLSA